MTHYFESLFCPQALDYPCLNRPHVGMGIRSGVGSVIYAAYIKNILVVRPPSSDAVRFPEIIRVYSKLRDYVEQGRV